MIFLKWIEKYNLKRVIFCFFILGFLEVFLNIFLLNIESLNVNITFNIIFLISVIQYGCSLFYIYKIHSRISFFLLFVFATYFFYFGYHLLFFLGFTNNILILVEKLPINILINTSFIQLYCINIITIGYILFLSVYNNSQIQIKKISNNDSQFIQKMVLVIFIICGVAKLYILINEINLANEIGYAERVLNAGTLDRTIIFRIMHFISAYFEPALFGLFVFNYKKIGYLTAIIFGVFYLKTGSRMFIFCLVFILIYFLFSYFKTSTSYKDLIKLISLFAIVGLIFVIVSNQRSVISKDYNFSSTVEQALTETGTIFETNATVLSYCPSQEEHIYGRSYLAATLYVLPNSFTGDYPLNEKNVESIFSPYAVDYGLIGSSFIAESYYNFGWLCLLLMLVVGAFWATIDYLMIIVKEKNPLYTLSILTVFYYSFILVRADILQLPRLIIWALIPFYCILFLYRKLKKGGNN